MESKQKQKQLQTLNQTLDSSFEQNAQINNDNIFPGTILKPIFTGFLNQKKGIKGKSFKQIQSEIQKVQTKATVKMQQFDHKRFQKYLEELNKDNINSQRQSEISDQPQSQQNNSNYQGMENQSQYANKGQKQNNLEKDQQNLFYQSIVQNKKLQQSDTQELIKDKKQSQALQDLQFFVKQNKGEQNKVKVLKDDENTNFLKQELDRLRKRNSKLRIFGSIVQSRKKTNDIDYEKSFQLKNNQKLVIKTIQVTTNDSQQASPENNNKNLRNKPWNFQLSKSFGKKITNSQIVKETYSKQMKCQIIIAILSNLGMILHLIQNQYN